MRDRKPVFWDREVDLKERGQEMWARAMKLHTTYGKERRDALAAALTVYYGNERHALAGSNYTAALVSHTLGVETDSDQPPGENIIQEVLDMMVSHTIHDKVRPFFLTEKADSDAREQAQGMMRAVEGVLSSEGMWDELGTAVCKLGFMSDGGFVDAVPDYARNKVTLRLVLPHQWLVEQGERIGFHYELVDRWMLLEDFGYELNEDGEKVKTEFYDAILDASAAPSDFRPGDDVRHAEEVCDQILVITGYHRPSGYVDLDERASFGLNEDGEVDDSVDPGHDGVRMVMIDGHVLHHEPYAYDELPICEFFPAKDPISYGSRGVPETLAGLQLAVNKCNRRIEDMLHYHARALLVVWRNAKINTNKITNGPATILLSNVPPAQAIQHIQPQAVSPALVERVERLKAAAKAQYGVNDTALAGEKPAGVDHAPGMEHLAEELTLRHTEKSDGWKRLFTKLFRRIVECLRMLALRDPDFEVVFQDDRELERIKWKEVELERYRYSAKCWPTNLLAKTPAAKMRRISELQAMQVVTPEQTRGVLIDEFPDMRAIIGDVAAAERNLRRKIDRVAKDGLSESNMPMPYNNLALAKVLAAEKINALEEEGNERGVEEVAKFWQAAHELELAAARDRGMVQGNVLAAQAAGGGGPPGTAPPVAPPMMPPPEAAGSPQAPPLPGMV